MRQTGRGNFLNYFPPSLKRSNKIEQIDSFNSPDIYFARYTSYFLADRIFTARSDLKIVIGSVGETRSRLYRFPNRSALNVPRRDIILAADAASDTHLKEIVITETGARQVRVTQSDRRLPFPRLSFFLLRSIRGTVIRPQLASLLL